MCVDIFESVGARSVLYHNMSCLMPSSDAASQCLGPFPSCARSYPPKPVRRPHLPGILLIAIGHLHALCTSCNPASLLHTIQLSPSRLLRLALHEIIIVRPTSRSDKETCGEQRRRTATNLLDLWDAIWEGGGIEENVLIESVSTQLISPFTSIKSGD